MDSAYDLALKELCTCGHQRKFHGDFDRCCEHAFCICPNFDPPPTVVALPVDW